MATHSHALVYNGPLQIATFWEDFGGVGLESPLFGEPIQLLKDLVLNAWLQNSSPSTKGTNKYVNFLDGIRIRLLYDIMYQELTKDTYMSKIVAQTIRKLDRLKKTPNCSTFDI